MLLSDAMMLGGTLGEELSNENYDVCLIGQACHALGKQNDGNEAAMRMWPWIIEQKYFHPEMPLPFPWYATMIISSLCSEVIHGDITREKAAAWVRSVEPPEAAAEQPQEAVPELAECAK